MATIIIGSIFGFNIFSSEKKLLDSTTSNNELSQVETVNTSTWEPAPVEYTQPTSDTGAAWDWVGYSEEEKEAKRAEAARIYGILNDYTFKLFMPCGTGTGWILDYQIPEKGGYPTKWYIATSSHVIWRLNFLDNTYQQNLPKSDKWVQRRREKNKSELERNMKDLWPVENKCDVVDKLGYVDLNISQQETGQARRADIGAIVKGEMYAPKLFYAAFNFLDKEKVGRNHFADFSVLEFEFTSQEAARRATNDFATKYENNPAAINLFGKPVEKRYSSKEEFWKAKDNYYLLAYPRLYGKNQWDYTTNFNKKTAIASQLIGNGWELNEENKNKYKGFVSAKETTTWGRWTRKFTWNGEDYHEFGYRYQFVGNPLAAGASGGLYVDSDGVAVAVAVQSSANYYGTGRMTAWAQPLRSIGATEEEAGAYTPAYDLILGAEGQKNSYKQQVQKYLLKNGKRTWLSTKGNWTI